MESWIKIKAGQQEMKDFYFNDPEILVNGANVPKMGVTNAL